MRGMASVVGLLVCGFAAGAADDKGRVVSLGGLKSKAPADWKEEKPANELRVAQFLLPVAKGDKNDAELVIFRAGGGARANIERWKKQFTSIGASNITDIKIGDRPATLLDITGTLNTPPFDPRHKGARLPGYRMLAIYFDAPDNAFQIKLYGPEKTIEQHKKSFENWLKAFK
jgi:gluconolactonase